MSSGTLPFQQYHRTCHLGDGTFGSVVKVYNDDGDEYAMKLFLEDHDDEDNDDDDDDDDDEYTPAQPMSIGTLRELSCLRVLRGENAHANIIAMVDVQPPRAANDDDDDGHGAGTSHSMGLTLPLGRYGSLADAISQQRFVVHANNNNNKSQKVHFTSGLLSAIHYLHETWGIAHRDIKSDNILLEYHHDHPERWVPILIDFSLAKPISTIMWSGNKTSNNNNTDSNNCSSSNSHCATMLEMEQVPHTGEVGTLIYTAPEVILATEPGFYDPKAIDMYSIGVVLLELIQNHSFTALKYKEARVQIQSALDALPPNNFPFPHLIRQLCATDPVVRLTAVEAVQHPVFAKFGIDPSTMVHAHHIADIQTALPHDFPSPAANDENQPPRALLSSSSHESNSISTKKYERRRKMIDRILVKLDSDHPLTRHAAWDYSRCFEQVDDTMDDDVDGVMTTSRPSHLQKNNHLPSQSLLDCCLLAYRFYELQVLDLPSAVTQYYPYWDYDDYIDNEMTILMMMDYCLYPRSLAF